MSTAAAMIEPDAPPQIPPDLILVSDAAKSVGKSLGFIYLHIRSGRLRGFKAGRYTYVPRSEVDELMKPRPLEFVPYESRPRRSPARKAEKEVHAAKATKPKVSKR